MGNPSERVKKSIPVILSPSLVILSAAKNLRSSLRVDPAKDLRGFFRLNEIRKTAGILLPRLRDQNDRSEAFFRSLKAAATSN
jgi:hypothetical protein